MLDYLPYTLFYSTGGPKPDKGLKPSKNAQVAPTKNRWGWSVVDKRRLLELWPYKGTEKVRFGADQRKEGLKKSSWFREVYAKLLEYRGGVETCADATVRSSLQAMYRRMFRDEKNDRRLV